MCLLKGQQGYSALKDVMLTERICGQPWIRMTHRPRGVIAKSGSRILLGEAKERVGKIIRIQ